MSVVGMGAVVVDCNIVMDMAAVVGMRSTAEVTAVGMVAVVVDCSLVMVDPIVIALDEVLGWFETPKVTSG